MGVVVVDLTAKDNVSQTLSKVDSSARKLNKTITDSRGKLRNAQGQFVAMSKSAGTARQSVKLLGTTFSTYLGPVVAIGAAITGVSKALSIMGDREADTAALANGLKGLTTNGAAALDELKSKADELGKATLFNEEDFTKSFKMLTSFRTIGVSSYGKVAETAADMAQVLGQDVNGVMLQVAKALEAPDIGLTALQRSGTRFTAQQKEQVKAMVKANNVAGAQAFILKELNKQYGGAAKSAATGFAGVMDTLGEVTRDAFEAFGNLIAPGVIGGISLLSTGIEKLSGFFQVLGQRVMPLFQSALQPVIETMQGIFKDIPFDKVANIIGNQIVNGFVLLGNVLKFVSPLIVGIVKALVEGLKNSPLGFIVRQAYRLAEAMGLTKPLIEDSAKASNKLGQGFNDIPGKINAAVDAKKKLTEQIKINQEQIKTETIALEGQNKIFGLQVKAAQSVLAITQARNKFELSALKLEESRLQRQLGKLQRIDGFYKKQRSIIDKIAKNRKKQAQIEFKVAQQSIRQMVHKSELEHHSIKSQVQKINLQVELLRLQAEEIQNTEKKLETLDRINQQAKTSAAIASQMLMTSTRSLNSAREIAKFQRLSAQHLLDGKLESIEAERVDARRAIHAASIAKSVKATSSATSSGSSSGSGSAGSVSDAVKKATTLGPAGRTTQTMSTAGPIDPEVYKKVLDRAPVGGFRNPADLVTALDKAMGYYGNGGHVSGAQLAMIGEKGPEYVIPEKKAASFATNYLMGARGASAIPGYAEGGYTGSINIQTGPVMQQDNETYLTMGQFEEGIRELTESLSRGGRSYGSRQFQGVS